MSLSSFYLSSTVCALSRFAREPSSLDACEHSCGVLRLARFNATVHEMASPEGKVVYYEGTPIPSTVFITLLLSGLVYQGHQQALLDAVSTLFGARYHVIPLFYNLLFRLNIDIS